MFAPDPNDLFFRQPLFLLSALPTPGTGPAAAGNSPVTGVSGWLMSHVATNQVQERGDDKIHLC
jgi:hypothetical protein